MKVDGVCACGAIKVEAQAAPEKTAIAPIVKPQPAPPSAFRFRYPARP